MENKDILYYVLIFAVLIGIVLLVIWVKGESKDCLLQPFEYGASHLGDGKLSCSCYNNRGGIYEFNETSFVGKSKNQFSYLNFTN